MNRTLAANVVLALVLSGCGVLNSSEPRSAGTEVKPRAAKVVAKAKVAAASETAPARRVGDFFVHRFSGSFTKVPLTLTEEVIAKEEGAWVVEYALEDGEGTTRIRVRQDSANGAILRVSTLEDGHEVDATLDAFERFLSRTTFAADANEGLIEEAARTCVIGPSELDCETKSYRVLVGDKEATLSVSQSKGLPGRDVGGDITAADGSLIYRSEIIDMGRNKDGGLGAGVAASR